MNVTFRYTMKSDKLFEFCGGDTEVVGLFEEFMYGVVETLRVKCLVGV